MKAIQLSEFALSVLSLNATNQNRPRNRPQNTNPPQIQLEPDLSSSVSPAVHLPLKYSQCFRSKTQHSPSYTWKKSRTRLYSHRSHGVRDTLRSTAKPHNTGSLLSYNHEIHSCPRSFLSLSLLSHFYVTSGECESPQCVANCALTFTFDDNAS